MKQQREMKADPLAAESLHPDWHMLCAKIGERRAGTNNEVRAARYIKAQFAAAGLKNPVIKEFSCTSLRSSRAEVSFFKNGRWLKTEANTLVGAPGTPGNKPVEAEVVWLEMPECMGRLQPDCLHGKIAALFGPLPTSVAQHLRLMAANPAAILQVDERLPFTWAKSDGVFPYWARRYGVAPTVTVPYMTAWNWRLAGVSRIRVRVQIKQVAAPSTNVTAELRGSEPHLPPVLVAAHHDTQCGNPGADDNASGVVCVLALARWLAARKHRRTFRFVSFGTEEQLSVGAAAYVQAHRKDAASFGLMVNFDSVSSPLGHFEMECAGHSDLAKYAQTMLTRNGIDIVVRREITPFLDVFPFNWAGIPSLSFQRSNCSGGRWQHHSGHDTLANVSVAETARLLRAVAALLENFGSCETLPFRNGLPPAHQRKAARLGRELLGI